jgi:hypothetical protein
MGSCVRSSRLLRSCWRVRRRGPARCICSPSPAQAFVQYLARRGRVDFAGHADRGRVATHPRTRKTHVVTQQAGRLALLRRCFDCGLDPA